jgi:hypothetical protein
VTVVLVGAGFLAAFSFGARRFWARQPRRHWKSRTRWPSEPEPNPHTKHVRELLGSDQLNEIWRKELDP